jgi:acyl-CoA reductase-like NAD-dependent aldehyde dehydrogenase
VQAAADLSADDVRSALSLSADASPLVEDLTPAERAAFVRLLHAEMERTQ